MVYNILNVLHRLQIKYCRAQKQLLCHQALDGWKFEGHLAF